MKLTRQQSAAVRGSVVFLIGRDLSSPEEEDFSASDRTKDERVVTGLASSLNRNRWLVPICREFGQGLSKQTSVLSRAGTFIRVFSMELFHFLYIFQRETMKKGFDQATK